MNFDDVDGVLFDMDGTLVDSEPHTLAAMEAVLNEHGLGPLTLGPADVFGMSWDAISERMLSTHHQISSDSLVDALILHFRRICSTDGATLLPGVLDFFTWAADHHAVGLFTSNVRSEVDALLGEHADFRRLEAIVTADDVAEAKPNPEGYLLLAKILGLEPARCVVFEDSLAGLRAAKAAGMRTVGVTHSCSDVSIISPHADTLISDYRVLSSFIGGRPIS